MGDPRLPALLATLRAALPTPDDVRLLIGLPDERERRVVEAALGSARGVTVASGAPDLLRRMEREPHDLVLADVDSLPAAAAIPPSIERLVVGPGDPDLCARLFSDGATAVLPRPLPSMESLLRAHLRWLIGGWQARRMARLGRPLYAIHAEILRQTAPGLAAALAEIDEADTAPVTALIIGTLPAGVSVDLPAATHDPDVIIVGAGASDSIEARLRALREPGAGSALIVYDMAPGPERLAAAIWGGVRAVVTPAEGNSLTRIAARVGAQRRSESAGRTFTETLARFGVVDDDVNQSSTNVARPTNVDRSTDVDARLIGEVAASSTAFVPSGHEVLIVDDEPVVLTVLREALRRGGYSVTTAASAEEAIDLFGKRSFDLVLTDKNLPGASGLEVLRVARTLRPPPAVVLITGYSSYDSALEAFDDGALDYIEKPIKDLEVLRQRVRRALSRRDEQLSRSESRPPPTAARVLIVDVEGERRQLMAEFLGRSYRVTTVPDGDRALVRLEAERFDVVLADRNLPGLSGLRVIEQARRLLPHCAAVLYTAYPSYETVKEAFELGVDAFCVRPSDDLKALGEKVAGALRGRGGILLG